MHTNIDAIPVLKRILSYKWVKFRKKLLKIEIYHMNMMLKCNLKLLVECFCFQMPAKALVNLRTAQDFVE